MSWRLLVGFAFWVQAPEKSSNRFPRPVLPSIDNGSVVVILALSAWFDRDERPPTAPVLSETERKLNMTKAEDLNSHKIKVCWEAFCFICGNSVTGCVKFLMSGKILAGRGDNSFK